MQTRDVVTVCVYSVKDARRGGRHSRQDRGKVQLQLSAHQRRLLAAPVEPYPLPCARFEHPIQMFAKYDQYSIDTNTIPPYSIISLRKVVPDFIHAILAVDNLYEREFTHTDAPNT